MIYKKKKKRKRKKNYWIELFFRNSMTQVYMEYFSMLLERIRFCVIRIKTNDKLIYVL
jgi:hypothetical protein